MTAVFAEVRRVLKPDGTLWLNLGDCYATGAGKVGACPGGGKQGEAWAGRGNAQPKTNGRGETQGYRGAHGASPKHAAGNIGPMTQANRMPQEGLKPKDLVGIPWRVAFALQEAGWYLRQDIIWSKPNPMPESVTDRCTKAHEYIFLLTKSARYFYDAEAIAEQTTDPEYRTVGKIRRGTDPLYDATGDNGSGRYRTGLGQQEGGRETRNKRSVWTVTTQPYKEAHFATFAPDLIKPCILAGTKYGDTVLDPFGGSGTTGMVATELGRESILIELNPDYAALADRRTDVTMGLPM